MQNKKAQLTLFIAIGVVLVMIAGIYFYATTEMNLSFEESKEKIVGDVPVEFYGIFNYIENCLYTTAQEGLIKLGSSGGVLDMSNYVIADPTSSDAVRFLPGSSWVIPYWRYLKGNNQCTGACEFVVMPHMGSTPLKLHKKGSTFSIEGQLDKYIEDNIEGCLDNFKAFKEQGYGIKDSNLKVKSSVAEEGVVIALDYPVEISKDGVEEVLYNYITKLDVNFKKIFELASTITRMEANYTFLERNVLNLISAYSDIDDTKLPPFYEVGFGFTSVMWMKNDVEDKITGLLQTHINEHQIYNSYNYDPNYFPDDPIIEGMFSNFILRPSPSGEYSSLGVDFDYFMGWKPIYFDLNCDGMLCRPESILSDLGVSFGFHRYIFAYDISFPVLVEINDPFAFNERGYSFYFFLEGNIRDNEPLNTTFNPLETVVTVKDSMLCDEDKRNSGDVNVYVTDAKTGDALKDVRVTYSCLGESCLIGMTDDTGELSSKFPVCVGGVVSYLKEGYLGKGKLMNAYLDVGGSQSMELEPFREKEIIIEKKVLDKGIVTLYDDDLNPYTEEGWIFDSNPKDLYYEEEIVEEKALISLTRKNEPGDEDHIAVLNYDLTDPSQNNLTLVPGVYDVNIVLTLSDKNKIIINESICTGWDFADLICFGNTSAIVIEFNETNSLPSGGLELEIEIEKSDLDTYDKITFYAVSPDLRAMDEEDRTMEDLGEIGLIANYSEDYSSYLQPTFS
jgi:hypothetical protein